LSKKTYKQQTKSKPNFETAVRAFANVERLGSKTDILSFWKNNATDSILRDVAYTILSVPGTQVSVEQLFSQLKFILSDLRWSLSPENLQNILIVRCNFAHLDAFFDKF